MIMDHKKPAILNFCACEVKKIEIKQRIMSKKLFLTKTVCHNAFAIKRYKIMDIQLAHQNFSSLLMKSSCNP